VRFSCFNSRTKNGESGKDPLGLAALRKLLADFSFESVLDIGIGTGFHSRQFIDHGKTVTGISLQEVSEADSYPGELIVGDYLEITFSNYFDCIWASHVLEHQLSPHVFLKKVHSELREGGVLALTVPPLKHEVVGGHLSLWNAGLLVYHLVLAGFDCHDCSILKYGYNISVLVKKTHISLPKLGFRRGDLELLSDFFPPGFHQDMQGDIEEWNWS